MVTPAPYPKTLLCLMYRDISTMVVVVHLITSLTFLTCRPAVPNHVMASFNNEFPASLDVCWSAHGSNWQATFYQKPFHYRYAYYSASGKRVYHEFEVALEEVPKELLDLMPMTYPLSAITNVYKRIYNNTYQYIFESIHQGFLMGITIDKYGKIEHLAPEHPRFATLHVIENN